MIDTIMPEYYWKYSLIFYNLKSYTLVFLFNPLLIHYFSDEPWYLPQTSYWYK